MERKLFVIQFYNDNDYDLVHRTGSVTIPVVCDRVISTLDPRI